MGKVAVTELGYAGFGVSNVEAWRTFASDILGAENYEEGGALKLRIDGWHQRIILHPGQGDDLLFLGFRVAGSEEFREMQLHLKDCGIDFEVAAPDEAADRCVLELLRLQDPAGIPVEIFHGPRVDREKPFRPGRGMHGKFKTGTGGLGHLVIAQAEDVAATHRFYGDILGLRGDVEMHTQVPGGQVQPIFMHCNERDHTIAFGAPTGGKRLHHMMLEVDNINDVGLAYDLVKKSDFKIGVDLGCHANDQMISFYVQTPSGWLLEYGFGGAQASHQSEYSTAEIWGHEFRMLD